MTKKQCTTYSCYLRNIKVETEIENCLACDEELQTYNPLGSIFDDLADFSGKDAAAWFGGRK